jgi:NTE family protein
MTAQKRDWLHGTTGWRRDFLDKSEPRIGLALGGGFARGIAHVGILRVLEREHIPLHCITGVSAGAIVAAAFASGANSAEIGAVGASMRFADVAAWNLCRLGLVGSERMIKFLPRLLRHMKFEDMQIPLGIVATDVGKGEPVLFRDKGDVTLAIRASCSYPGLFRPVEASGRVLVDGAISVEVPALLARKMGATRVISVCIPAPREVPAPHNMLEVVNRCFQIMMARTEESWRKYSDSVITPEIGAIVWDGFSNAQRLIEAGEAAAEKALPRIRKWLRTPAPATAGLTAGESRALIEA